LQELDPLGSFLSETKLHGELVEAGIVS